MISEPKSTRHDGWKVALVCVALTAAVGVIFGQTWRARFVNIDDGVYVFQNPLITAGLTRAGIGWVFAHAYGDYWAPLLAVSHMADCQFYGLWPGGHHLTNVLLFGATVLLLFFVLRRMTGALWPSAFVVAAWAVHPLRAESVAWVTERKDMLSGLFFLLTLAAYLGYVRAPRSWTRYLAVALLFALGLMCKPTIVTLPGVLLLLDYWPLRRLGPAGGWAAWRPLLVEKIPLLALSAALCLVTILTAAPTLVPLQQAAFPGRLSNAVLSAVIYLGETVYPVGLAAYYPYPAQTAPLWETGLALALLAAITAAAIAGRRTQPWLAVGWFWYLLILTPMIGLVQSGQQAHADRFTYLAQIGLLVAFTWSAWHHGATLRRPGVWLGAPAVLAALLVCSRVQTSYWRDSETLWTHALACTSGNAFAENNLGVALLEAGQRDAAAAHFQAAVAIQPRHVRAQYNLANVLRESGRLDEASAHYEKALAVDPGYFDALNNLGISLASAGRTDEAAAVYGRALALRPESADVHLNFGHALLAARRTGEAIGQFSQAVALAPGQTAGHDGLGGALLLANRPAEAALQYRRALELQPADVDACSGLGSAWFLQGRLADAVSQWEKALALQPEKLSTLNNLGWVLATGPAGLRDGSRAVAAAEHAARLSGGKDPVVLQTLAAAYAAAGRFADARETAGVACQLATKQSKPSLAGTIQEEQRQYAAGRPLQP